jgi:hypothetical protein
VGRRVVAKCSVRDFVAEDDRQHLEHRHRGLIGMFVTTVPMHAAHVIGASLSTHSSSRALRQPMHGT